jgi:Peptidase family M23
MQWTDYPILSNYGYYPDPYGPYPKPDANIECPPGTSVTALGDGTVSGVQQPSYMNGEWSVTVRLDTPINYLATHEAYNFLGSVNVQTGDSVNTGEEIGKSGHLFAAFALTNDEIYGTDTFLKYDGNPLLDPGLVLDNAKSPMTGDTATASSASVSSSSNFLVTVGEWISENFFRVSPDVVKSTSAINSLPYAIIGGVSLGLVALIVVGAFVMLVGI